MARIQRRGNVASRRFRDRAAGAKSSTARRRNDEQSATRSGSRAAPRRGSRLFQSDADRRGDGAGRRRARRGPNWRRRVRRGAHHVQRVVPRSLLGRGELRSLRCGVRRERTVHLGRVRAESVTELRPAEERRRWSGGRRRLPSRTGPLRRRVRRSALRRRQLRSLRERVRKRQDVHGGSLPMTASPGLGDRLRCAGGSSSAGDSSPAFRRSSARVVFDVRDRWGRPDIPTDAAGGHPRG